MDPRTRSFLLAAPFVLSVFAATAHETSQQAKPPEGAHSAHWSYEGPEGPAHWGQLDPAYVVCGTGKHQSPIDIPDATSKDLEKVDMHDQPSEVRILNNGHTVQVNYDKGSYLEVNGQRYEVVQFHYHVPSEHRLKGKAFAAELHVVHKNAAGQLAVIGILLEEGAENPAFQAFLTNLPEHESKEEDKGVKINVADLLPAAHTAFRYDGSLTTPPCTEGVAWFVMTTPVQLSVKQIASLERVFKRDNRPVQPLNGRTITLVTIP